MKKFSFASLAAIVLVTSGQFVMADDTNETSLSSEVEWVTAQVAEKFKAGKTTEADLAENLKSINGLIVKHLRDSDREYLARLYLLDAHIYADGLDNSAKAKAIWTQVVRDFPGTKAAAGAKISLARLNAQSPTGPEPQVAEGLEPGMKFPKFDETDVAGKSLALAAYRGKVVLVDFWATWCGPCRAELPNVIEVYKNYHAQGFEILGVSLDKIQDRLTNFTQAQGMTWPQYFDGQGWQNRLAMKYQVHAIPMTYLLDRRGIIIGKKLRGKELVGAVAKAVADK